MKLLAINSAHGSSVLRIDTAGLVACLILSAGAYLIGARPLIASRELAAYLKSPLGYIVAAAVLFVVGMLFNLYAMSATAVSADVLREFVH